MARLEKDIRKEIVNFLRDIMGASVWDTEQGYSPRRGGARVTAGLPDLVVFLASPDPMHFYIEVKSAKGKLRPAQIEFQKCCLEASVGYLVARDVREVWDYLAFLGAIESADTR